MPHLMFAAIDPIGIIMVVIGLGGLIFFHELGHVLACVVTGTRVEVFSIGFGPKLFGWRRGHTLYRVAAIPLGGYVKMAAENPGEQGTGAPDELPNKSFSQRLLIFSAGVIFNLVLGALLFAWAYSQGIQFIKSEVGEVTPGGAAWIAGVQRGDVVTHVDGGPVDTFQDLKMEVATSSADTPLHFRLKRGDKTLEVDVTPQYIESLGHAQIGVRPTADPRASEVQAGSPIAKAGGRKNDVVLSVNGLPVRDALSPTVVMSALQEIPSTTGETTLAILVRRDSGEEETLRVKVPLQPGPFLLGLRAYRGRVVHAVRPERKADGFLIVGDELLEVNGDAILDLDQWRARATDKPVTSIRFKRDGKEKTATPAGALSEQDLSNSVAGARDLASSMRVLPAKGGAAEAAGVLPGDKVLRIGKTEVSDWEQMRKAVQEHGAGPITVQVERDGEKKELTLTAARVAEYPDLEEFVSLGYQYGAKFVMHKETNAWAALGAGWRRTKYFVRSVMLTIRSLVTARVSARHIGGPIMLAELSYDTWERGFGRYLYVLALISINLAILNLLPIPVLDGGQIVLLVAEKIRGQPLPEKVIGVFQIVGLVMILGLMVLAFTNDITRMFQ